MRERVHMAAALRGYDPYPYERSGTPDVWGHGLRHAVIAGTDKGACADCDPDGDAPYDALRGDETTPPANASTMKNVGKALVIGGTLAAILFRKDKSSNAFRGSIGVGILGVMITTASGH